MVAAILVSHEERLQQIALAEEEERLRQEIEELVRETETAERAQEEAVWAQESALALAESRAKEPRDEFVAQTYTPPEPHVFVPLRVDGRQLCAPTEAV